MKLPLREAFYSKLNMSGVGNEDYDHVNRVWTQIFGRIPRSILKNGRYPISKCLRGIYESLFKELWIGSSSLLYSSWISLESLLKERRIRLELLLDPDMLLMFERGIRGGITQSL